MIIAGNWKMHKTAAEAIAFIETLKSVAIRTPVRVLLAVPFTSIHAAVAAARGSPIEIGAQNMHDAPYGAYTGEVSASMLKEAGARFVLLGHSERRRLFLEDDALIARKLKRALSEGLKPILCVGETAAERGQGETAAVLEQQLDGCLAECMPQELKNLTLAYEPVWAIGTGQIATPEMARDAHGICRAFLTEQWDLASLDILYGGSVTADSLPTLRSQPGIDGVLVGGASLDVQSFIKIINTGGS